MSAPIPLSSGMAMNLAGSAGCLADDAAAYAEAPTEQNRADLMASMSIMLRRIRVASAEMGEPMSKVEAEDFSQLSSHDQAEVWRRLGGSVYGNLTRQVASAFLQRQGWTVSKPKSLRSKARKP